HGLPPGRDRLTTRSAICASRSAAMLPSATALTEYKEQTRPEGRTIFGFVTRSASERSTSNGKSCMNMNRCLSTWMAASRRQSISNHRAARTGVCLAIMFAGFPDFAQNPPSTPWASEGIDECHHRRALVHKSRREVSSPTRDMPLYQHLIEMLPPLGIGVFLYD